MRVEFHPLAEEELIEQAAYYNERVPGLGAAFVSEAEAIAAALLEHPQIGALLDADMRTLPLRRFPHSLIYAVEGKRVLVLAIAHQKRKPGYWRQRRE
jgi:plasmid stabilization system protein ParE